MPALAHDRRRRMSPAVLTMAGPCDPKVQRCVFCNQVFKDGEDWFKIGYPRAGYIAPSVTSSAGLTRERRLTWRNAGGSMRLTALRGSPGGWPWRRARAGPE